MWEQEHESKLDCINNVQREVRVPFAFGVLRYRSMDSPAKWTLLWNTGLRDGQPNVSWPSWNEHRSLKRRNVFIGNIIDWVWHHLEYRKTLVADKLAHSDEVVAGSFTKNAKCLQLQMKSQVFASFDPIFTVSFLSAFKWACRTYCMKESAVWLLQLFMRRPEVSTQPSPLLSHQVGICVRRDVQSFLTVRWSIILLKMYATDILILIIDAHILHFKQMSNNLPSKYNEALWNKALRWDSLHEEYVLKAVFTKRLMEAICHSMSSWWGSKNEKTLQYLTRLQRC